MVNNSVQYARRIHARRRFRERTGIKFTRKVAAQCVNQIHKQKAEFLRRYSKTRTLWAVKIDGIRFVVVYNKRSGQIVTVLVKNSYAG